MKKMFVGLLLERKFLRRTVDFCRPGVCKSEVVGFLESTGRYRWQ